ncbi:uncharacterized protein LOC142533335 [Primulina tabacum]|uniref:uncharacterized protein LOC142533335 n=1 Tax=Primulina tabacum TaxID=48773 RepID=UPI003F5AA59F
MVNYMLMISAELENLTDLQPQDGCDDANFAYYFKLKCGNCGEVTQKETCVSLNETVSSTKGKGETHLAQKCKFCTREGTVTMISGRGRPLTQADAENGKSAPLMLFDCRGYEPLDFVFGSAWKVESIEGTTFTDVDLSGGEFVEYDEKGGCPVMISNLLAVFTVVK